MAAGQYYGFQPNKPANPAAAATGAPVAGNGGQGGNFYTSGTAPGMNTGMLTSMAGFDPSQHQTNPFGGPGDVAPRMAATTAANAPTKYGPLSGPGDYESFYKQHGQDLMNDPSASEKLYAEGAAGSNPYYDYATEQATNSVNAAERARGGYNSGAAIQEIGNASANLRGQQAHELGMLAGQADQGRQGRYGLTGQMADTSQTHAENRITGGIGADTALGGSQAGTAGGYYAEASKAMQAGDTAAAEAQLKAAGMSAAEIKQFTDLFTNAAGMAVKAAS